MTNNEAQSDELLALSSIYEQNSFSFKKENDVYTGYFVAHLDLPQPFYIKSPQIKGCNTENLLVQHLPPILLHFCLPADYPSRAPPKYTLSCIWLTEVQLLKLRSHLNALWIDNENEVILFHWIQFLLGETLQFLNITSFLDLYSNENLENDSLPNNENSNSINSRTQNYLSSTNLFYEIAEYDKSRQKETFNGQIFTCKVCFSERFGAQCICFSDCNHVYCKECMRNYFEVRIKDGHVRLLNCPEEKCTSQAFPSQVRELVSKELFDKYDQLLLSSTLDTMSDVMFCPRVFCQCPVMIEPNWTMGSCPNCRFVFCIFCTYAYHGVAPCRFKSGDKRKLLKEYKEANDSQKQVLEKRYGKRNLQVLAEDVFSEDWLESNSKKCPHCSAAIEKLDGCNKMNCWKCGTFFCWLCMSQLSKTNPYNHYSNPNSNCVNQLFYGTGAEENNEWLL